ncbi:MAG: NAD(P)/FAD-dependent oxidoreductase [Sandarakinorhabdus sp.]|nr:NAD(P)/FAD-dependent oxidoreductase [Sandarakinorhabdus sp.]
MERIDSDYLLIGAGAMGLAFADTLLTELPEATITIVDRHGKPGGHWNDAYPFVSLHQPSSFYGVASLPLGAGRIDTHGINAGFHELASGPEVSGYFDAVMRRMLLPTGRVRYFPMSEHRGGGRIVSLISGQETQVDVARKTIDSTFLATSVPSTHTRKFAVADGVRIMPPNGLPDLWRAPADMPPRFTVLGAGKTAMDTLIWLLGAGATPEMISWTAPRASWFFNRRCVQPGSAFFEESIGGQLNMMQALATATDATDLFLRLEACGFMLRIDRASIPTMFHYAIASEAEIAILQRVGDVIRMGRVQSLAPDRMVLEHGERAVMPGTLFIDCTASAVERRPPVPVFQPGLIVPQMIRVPQPAFSAAMIAWVEANIEGEAAQNALTMAVPLPDSIEDYPRASLVNLFNQGLWGQNKALSKWIHDCRLDGFGKTVSAVRPEETARLAMLQQFRPAAMAAMANLQTMVGA